MAEEAAVTNVRAAVEAIVPSVDGAPGAAELGVHHHVVESIDLFLPGFVDLLSTLLDAYANDVRTGAGFAELDLAERQEVFRAMSLEENADMQDIIDGLMVFTLGGFYSEWTARHAGDPDGAPAVWGAIGFHGPVEGHPVYRGGP